MSHNPWPYVVVMLGSLGFLANSMAQQNNRFSNPAAFDNGTNAQERGVQQQGSGARDSSFRVRSGNNADPTNPAMGLQEPTFDNVGSGAGQFEDQSFDELIGNSSGRRGTTLRRDSEPELAQIRIPARTNTDGLNRETVSPPVGGGRGPFPTNQRREFNANSGRRDNATITQQNTNDARFDGTDYKTKESSLFDSNRVPGAYRPNIAAGQNRNNQFQNPQRQSPQGVSTPEKEATPLLFPFQQDKSGAGVNSNVNAQKPTLSSGIASVFGTDDKEDTTLRADASGFTPTWFKWALFFSVGANLFFGYIAMNMHSRYQDLIEDMHVSESQLERQRPRRRSSVDRDDEAPVSSRQRRRDTDEAAFLHGGIEV